MGIGLWAISGVTAFFFARIVPWGRDRRWLIELITALLAAATLGFTATALDFGGWQEPDWRAAAFVCFGTFAAVGAVRALRARR
ncbi:MAG TPA: hypothetical protein VGF69_00175 [Thermoanaerobaculia bacterium]